MEWLWAITLCFLWLGSLVVVYQIAYERGWMQGVTTAEREAWQRLIERRKARRDHHTGP